MMTNEFDEEVVHQVTGSAYSTLGVFRIQLWGHISATDQDIFAKFGM